MSQIIPVPLYEELLSTRPAEHAPASIPPAMVLPSPAPGSQPSTGKRRAGRPRALDNLKMHKFFNLICRGCTIEEAARHVGCAASTIRREAKRNPEFNQQLHRLLLEDELFALQAVRNAAHRHWRAGRYLLERADAKRFRETNSRPLTPRQLRNFTMAIAAPLESEITDLTTRQRLIERLNQVLYDTNRSMANTPPSKPRRRKRTTSS